MEQENDGKIKICNDKTESFTCDDQMSHEEKDDEEACEELTDEQSCGDKLTDDVDPRKHVCGYCGLMYVLQKDYINHLKDQHGHVITKDELELNNSDNLSAANTLTYVSTIRGGIKLLEEGYMYVKDKAGKGGKVYWRCVDRKCPGRLTTQDETILTKKEHHHPGDAAQVEVVKCRDTMKRKAVETDQPLGVIYNEAVATLPPIVQVEFVKDVVKRDLSRKRQKLLPPPPSTLAELILEDEFRQTVNGDDWLAVDTGVDDPQRIIILATSSSLRRLAKAEHWFIDGNFKSCPQLFYQLFVIHAEVHEIMFPLAFVLMTGKTQDLYTRVFEELVGKMQNDGLQPIPLDVTLDFEKAMHNAVLEVFGGSTRVHGCFFHLRQSTWRQVQGAQLASRYNKDPEFAHKIRMIDALAYVPKSYIPEALDEVRKVIPDEAAPVLEWFSTNYICSSTGARKSLSQGATPPGFAIDIWNQFRLVIEGDRTTNNSLEAWHNHLENIFSKSHEQSIYKFIKMMKPEQAVIETEIAQAAAGIKKHKPKKNTIRNKQALYELCMDYHSKKTVVDYLSAVAHCFKL